MTYDEIVEMKRLHDDLKSGDKSELGTADLSVVLRALRIAVDSQQPRLNSES